MPKTAPMPTPVRLLGTLLRPLPLVSGPGNLANKPFFRRYTKAPDPVWLKTKWGHEILGVLDDYIGRSVAYFGDLDPKLSWILRTVLRPGDTFLDVGANIGLLTCLGAKLVGPTGHVLAIEPQPRMLDYLRATLQHNQLTNVSVAPVAVGQNDETLELHVPYDNFGSASLIDEPARIRESIEVPVRRFLNLLQEQNGLHPRLVKLDVEGWEAEVIQGALPHWQNTPPPAIIFEFREPSGTQVRDTSAGKLLADLDYTFFRMPKRPFTPRLLPAESSHQVACSHDVFAIHASTSAQKLGFAPHHLLNGK